MTDWNSFLIISPNNMIWHFMQIVSMIETICMKCQILSSERNQLNIIIIFSFFFFFFFFVFRISQMNGKGKLLLQYYNTSFIERPLVWKMLQSVLNCDNQITSFGASGGQCFVTEAFPGYLHLHCLNKLRFFNKKKNQFMGKFYQRRPSLSCTTAQLDHRFFSVC